MIVDSVSCTHCRRSTHPPHPNIGNPQQRLDGYPLLTLLKEFWPSYFLFLCEPFPWPYYKLLHRNILERVHIIHWSLWPELVAQMYCDRSNTEFDLKQIQTDSGMSMLDESRLAAAHVRNRYELMNWMGGLFRERCNLGHCHHCGMPSMDTNQATYGPSPAVVKTNTWMRKACKDWLSTAWNP